MSKPKVFVPAQINTEGVFGLTSVQGTIEALQAKHPSMTKAESEGILEGIAASAKKQAEADFFEIRVKLYLSRITWPEGGKPPTKDWLCSNLRLLAAKLGKGDIAGYHAVGTLIEKTLNMWRRHPLKDVQVLSYSCSVLDMLIQDPPHNVIVIAILYQALLQLYPDSFSKEPKGPTQMAVEKFFAELKKGSKP